MENQEILVKKCLKCGATVKVLKDCNCNGCGIVCCGEPMKEMKANTEDAAVEKHMPTYEIVDDKLVVKVNHAMDEDHYIEWISVVFGNKEITTYLKPGDEPVARCCHYEKGTKIYAYCNKHGLWMTEIK